MNGDTEQRLKTIEEKLEKVHKDVRVIKWQLILGSIISVLIIVVPIILLIYFLPSILDNFLGAYLPAGTDVNFQDVRGELQRLLQEQ